MNEVNAINPVTPANNISAERAAQRTAGLETARREATANRVADAEVAQQQRAEQFRQSNEIISRAIGANTRLEISTGQGSNPFTYRAVDVNTGEIVSEWPPEQFANLISALVSEAESAGIVVNEQV